MISLLALKADTPIYAYPPYIAVKPESEQLTLNEELATTGES